MPIVLNLEASIDCGARCDVGPDETAVNVDFWFRGGLRGEDVFGTIDGSVPSSAGVWIHIRPDDLLIRSNFDEGSSRA